MKSVFMTSVIEQPQARQAGTPVVQRAGILQNSFWWGVEIGLNVICTSLLSIAVARAIGPEGLGHFVYLVFLTNIANKFADLGTATAARKYMAEHLARGQMGLARSVFFTTLKLQTVFAIIVLVVGVLLAAMFGDPTFRLVGCILVAAIAPAILTSVPSQTNMAVANYSRNVPGAIAGLVAYTLQTILTLVLGWGLVGLAFAVFLRRSIELVWRLVPAMRWMSSLPKEPTSPALYRKLFTFSGHALAISAVVLIVNDRSEFVFLKHFCDIKQVAFYSVAFGLSEYLASAFLMFTGPIAAEFMADYAQGEDRAGSKAAKAMRFVSMIVLPVQFGLAAVSPALVRLAYGRAYLPAIPAVVVVAVLAVPKAFFGIMASIYKAADRQLIMLRYLVLAAVVNLALDATLIPRFGTIGAAFGNGLSQTFAVVAMWGVAARLAHLRMHWQSIARIAIAAIGMASVVALVCSSLRPVVAIFVGPLLGFLSYVVLLRVLRPLTQHDTETLINVGQRVPAPVRVITSVLFSRAAVRRMTESDWKIKTLDAEG